MGIEEIEDLAFQGAELPNGLDGADTLAFLLFRSLYDLARRIQMPPEQGKREKGRILATYRNFKSQEESFKKQQRRIAEFWKNIESAGSEYGRKPSIETADRFFKAVYNVERKGHNNLSV